MATQQRNLSLGKIENNKISHKTRHQIVILEKNHTKPDQNSNLDNHTNPNSHTSQEMGIITATKDKLVMEGITLTGTTIRITTIETLSRLIATITPGKQEVIATEASPTWGIIKEPLDLPTETVNSATPHIENRGTDLETQVKTTGPINLTNGHGTLTHKNRSKRQ